MVRQCPLTPKEPRYEVKYTQEALPEFAEHADYERLMNEIESVLAVDPFDPPGHRSEKVEGSPPLRRYRPHADNDSRVFYAVEGSEVWILGFHARKTAYRPANFRAALGRLRRAGGESRG
ncbi:MAG: hypothetical protein HY556_09840 [Euryarchaeota archaeon]|nr:hypothetical protein [Euryarchaeota archaeon]